MSGGQLTSDEENFWRLVRILLEDVPHKLRDLFRKKFQERFYVTWGENQTSGEFFIANSNTSRTGQHIINTIRQGDTALFDSTALFTCLLFSGTGILLPKPRHGVRTHPIHDSERIDDIREMRNELAHATSASLPRATFIQKLASLNTIYAQLQWNPTVMRQCARDPVVTAECVRLQQDLDAERQRYRALDLTVQALDVTVQGLDGTVQTLDETVQALDGTMQALDGTVHVLDGKVQVLDGTVQALDGTVQALDGTVQVIDGILQNQAGNVQDLDSRLTSAEGDVQGLDSRLTGAVGQVAGLDSRLTGTEGNDLSLDSRLTGAEGQVAGLDSQLTGTEAQVQRQKGRDAREAQVKAQVQRQEDHDDTKDDTKAQVKAGIRSIVQRFKRSMHNVKAQVQRQVEDHDARTTQVKDLSTESDDDSDSSTETSSDDDFEENTLLRQQVSDMLWVTGEGEQRISSSGGGTVDDKVGKDTRDVRESSPQPGRKLRGGKVAGCRETGRKEKESNGREDNRSEGEGREGDGRENNQSGRDKSKGVGSGGDMREGVRTECDGGDRTEELFCSSDRGGEEESEGVCGGFDS
ncbi:hypothetical protein LSAT2_001256 [Lamellibrachia satsuma]|nr:hypothetical protein LSAT2_001256 [Lamellibrachia satsuma]